MMHSRLYLLIIPIKTSGLDVLLFSSLKRKVIDNETNKGVWLKLATRLYNH